MLPGSKFFRQLYLDIPVSPSINSFQKAFINISSPCSLLKDNLPYFQTLQVHILAQSCCRVVQSFLYHQMANMTSGNIPTLLNSCFNVLSHDFLCTHQFLLTTNSGRIIDLWCPGIMEEIRPYWITENTCKDIQQILVKVGDFENLFSTWTCLRFIYFCKAWSHKGCMYVAVHEEGGLWRARNVLQTEVCLNTLNTCTHTHTTYTLSRKQSNET